MRKAGGGTVYIPPGEYTSGQLRVRSGVGVYVEAGATVYATLDSREFDPAPHTALFYTADPHSEHTFRRGGCSGMNITSVLTLR